jgi:ABC-type bacteriocin/lantibiotic exporter with double-glycine peptidase domain
VVWVFWWPTSSFTLARLLLRQPNILLLDEPTAAIDDVSEKQLIENLKGGWDKTLVIATHRRAVLEWWIVLLWYMMEKL